MSKIKHSLSKKLSLTILLMAAPIFVLALGALFLQSRYFIRQEATERANSLLNTTMQRLRNYMSTIETSTNANTWLIEENFYPDSLLVYSNRIVRLNRNVRSCSICAEPDMFPQYGRYFSVYTVDNGDTIETFREPEYEYFDRLWYKTPMEAGKACWVDPFYEHTEGTINLNEAIASYAKPLLRKDGTIVGIISTDLSFSRLADAINVSEKSYPNAYFMLIGGDGRYFIPSEYEDLLLIRTTPKREDRLFSVSEKASVQAGITRLHYWQLDFRYYISLPINCHTQIPPVIGVISEPNMDISFNYYSSC